MKRRIFLVSFLLFFFRLPIYESIAAIFWQSASYVNDFVLFLSLVELKILSDVSDVCTDDLSGVLVL